MSGQRGVSKEPEVALKERYALARPGALRSRRFFSPQTPLIAQRSVLPPLHVARSLFRRFAGDFTTERGPWEESFESS